MAKYYMLMKTWWQSTICSGKHGGKVLHAQENTMAKYYMLNCIRSQSTKW